MYVIETSCIGKAGQEFCEDICVVTESYAAVVDGTTAKTGVAKYEHGGKPVTRGLLAATVLRQAIAALPAELELQEVLDVLARAVESVHFPGVQPADRVSASAAIYSASKQKVWLIGDCQCLLISPDGQAVAHPNLKLIDDINSKRRAAVLHDRLARGESVTELLTNDPGRAAIMPALLTQTDHQNVSPANDQLAYAAIDGRPIPLSLIPEIHVGSGTS